MFKRCVEAGATVGATVRAGAAGAGPEPRGRVVGRGARLPHRRPLAEASPMPDAHPSVTPPPPPPPPALTRTAGDRSAPRAAKTPTPRQPRAEPGPPGGPRQSRGRIVHGHAVTGRAPAPFRREMALRRPCARHLDLKPSRPRRMPPCTETMARDRGRGRHPADHVGEGEIHGPLPRAGPSSIRGPSPVRGARSRTAPGTWMGVEKTDGGGAWRRRKGGFGWPGSWRLGPVCTRRSQRRCQKMMKQINLRDSDFR